VVIAVWHRPDALCSIGYRAANYQNDQEMKYRSFSPSEAQSRDYAEIENIEKAGPIAMADYLIVNEGDLEDFDRQLAEIYSKFTI
jgi:dephospho-CoA kinase